MTRVSTVASLIAVPFLLRPLRSLLLASLAPTLHQAAACGPEERKGRKLERILAPKGWCALTSEHAPAYEGRTGGDSSPYLPDLKVDRPLPLPYAEWGRK